MFYVLAIVTAGLGYGYFMVRRRRKTEQKPAR